MASQSAEALGAVAAARPRVHRAARTRALAPALMARQQCHTHHGIAMGGTPCQRPHRRGAPAAGSRAPSQPGCSPTLTGSLGRARLVAPAPEVDRVLDSLGLYPHKQNWKTATFLSGNISCNLGNTYIRQHIDPGSVWHCVAGCKSHSCSECINMTDFDITYTYTRHGAILNTQHWAARACTASWIWWAE